MRFCLNGLVVAVLAICPQIALAQTATCNQAAPSATLEVSLPGHPFRSVPTKDGCWIFTSLQGRAPLQAGIAVHQRNGGKVTALRVVPLENPSSIVLTNDDKILIVANNDYVEFLDAARLISGQGDPKLGRVTGGVKSTEAFVNVTADDKFLFVSDHGYESVSVYNLEAGRAAGFGGDFKVGTMPVGRASLSTIFSPDGKTGYHISEVAPSSVKWTATCGQNPEGVLVVFDAEKARKDPATAVIANVPAGCVAVRLALSPKGDRAYVTARGGNQLLVFDTAKLRSDGHNARIATIPVPPAPIGLAVVDGGSKVIVTSSQGVTRDPKGKQSLTVIDTAKVASGAGAIIGTIPGGGSPRELRVTADGKTAILTNATSDNLVLIDLIHLPLQPSGN
jgi:DNA-binding beta-propeller fold protein YncE